METVNATSTRIINIEDLADKIDIMELDVDASTKRVERMKFDIECVKAAIRLIASKDPRIAGRVNDILRAQPANTYGNLRTVVYEEPEIDFVEEEEESKQPISYEDLAQLPLMDRIERVLHYRKPGGRRIAAKDFAPAEGFPAKTYNWRTTYGLTRHEASLVTGLTVNQIYNLEHSKSVKYETVEKLIRLGCFEE